MSGMLLLVFAAAFVVIAAITASGLALFEKLLPAFPLRNARATWTHAALLLSPMVAALLGCVALAVQNPFSDCHCAAHGLHHPHLCVSHPVFGEPLALPSVGVLVVWMLIVAPRVVRIAREVALAETWARRVAQLPSELVDGIAVRLVDGGSRGAFTVGALSPVVVFERSLWEALSPDERRAVAHHEGAHVERRDGLTLVVLLLCGALYPVPLGGRLLARWRSLVESACDAHAARRLHDGTAVAEALLAVEKARAGAPPLGATAPVLGVGAASDLERRVLAVLAVIPAELRGEELGNDLVAVAILTCGASVLAVFWPGDALHHAIETVIGVLVQ